MGRGGVPKSAGAFFSLSILSGVYFLVSLARLPSDGGAGLLGLSFRRLAVVVPMALLILGMAAALVLLLRGERWQARWRQWTTTGPFLLGGCVLSAGLAAPLALLDLLRTLFRDSGDFRYSAFASRLAPFFGWLALVGLLLALTILIFHRRDLLRALGSEAGVLRPLAWIGLALALLVALVALTRTGFSGDPVGAWGLPTVPLLEWQIGLALAVTLALTFLLARLPASRRKDLIISLLVWGLAALLWASHPLVPGYFATPGRAPNYEVYPFSDGQIYDQYAQAVLVGNGFAGPTGPIPHRALYLAFLAGLHALAGQDYLKVILLQQLILALFPVILYWLGKELHSRPAGILAALLVTLRELTAIRAAPFTDNISYSKLYFSELPTAICLSAFTLFAVRWMKKANAGPRWSLDALLAGGFLGMAMLIRTQSFAALPLAALLALLVFRQSGNNASRSQRSESSENHFPYSLSRARGLNRRFHIDWPGWLRGLVLMMLAMLVCVLPWYARNFAVGGGPIFDNPDSQTLVLAQRYNNLTFGQDIPRLPGESESRYSSRLMGLAMQGILRDPLGNAWWILNHFANNQISNLLVFPIRLRIVAPAELAWPVSPFWQEWNGSLTPIQAGILLANLALLAVGLAGALCRQGPLAWTPLLVNLAYNFTTAVFRSSGGRFLLPVDWVAILLFALGSAQVFAWLLRGSRAYASLSPEPAVVIQKPVGARSPRPGRRVPAAAIILFLLTGASLPLAELAFPRLYPETKASLPAAFTAAIPAQAPQAETLRRFALQPGTVLIHGRALYPRYYEAGDEEPKTAKKGYTGLPYARLVFYVTGTQNTLVVLPLEQSPATFPNAADVWIAGCQEDSYIHASAVVVTQGTRPVYLAQGPGCKE